MKNIYIIPTDKPSRLRYNLSNTLVLTKNAFRDYRNGNQNIYITSEEKIKEGEYWKEGTWFLDIFNTLRQATSKTIKSPNDRKIILTDNKDLIKDGVQAIDDTFLEWFVNNPSCEDVEVQKEGYKKNGMIDESTSYRYKIIIPSEEPKQKVDMFKYIIGIDPYNEQKISKTNLERLRFPELVEELAKYYEKVPLLEEPKQETTLEEAADNYALHEQKSKWAEIVRNAFRDGVKWQQENSYSEEEVFELIGKFDYCSWTGNFIGPDIRKEWFELNKKK